ncbi:hypothetical protein c7_R527 [Megavirus courdo7]|uniref:Uncharacterized protein n=1 Tax=Megavirus courdo7 TaxID=1128135 RepID=H2EB17_9VIRU|nr:hypothetical protein c7_R527 [Megavirus courdo7]
MNNINISDWYINIDYFNK